MQAVPHFKDPEKVIAHCKLMADKAYQLDKQRTARLKQQQKKKGDAK